MAYVRIELEVPLEVGAGQAAGRRDGGGRRRCRNAVALGNRVGAARRPRH